MTLLEDPPLWRERASWSRGRHRAVGGHLQVTVSVVTFVPNRFEREVRHERISQWPRSEVTGVDLAPRALQLYSGALRRRLRLRMVHGDELFVVPRPRRTLRMVRSLFPGLP